jgi:hypothetical protein
MKRRQRYMVDNFAIGLTHVLMAIALWRMLYRDDLDREVTPRQQWKNRKKADEDAVSDA